MGDEEEVVTGQAAEQMAEQAPEEVVETNPVVEPAVTDFTVDIPSEIELDSTIAPKVGLGETVLYTAGADDAELYGRGLAAIVVCCQENTGLYNLVVFTPWGGQLVRSNVPFQLAHDVRPDHSYFTMRN